MTDYDVAKAKARASTAQRFASLTAQVRSLQANVRRLKIRLAKATAAKRTKVNSVRQLYQEKLAAAAASARSDKLLVRSLRKLLLRVGDELSATASKLKRKGRFPTYVARQDTGSEYHRVGG